MPNYNLLAGRSVSAHASDSRPDLWDYNFAFEIIDSDQLPTTLDAAVSQDFRRALFLPKDDPDWFGRSSYPPRVLILTGRAITCIEYERRRVSTTVFDLKRICQVELGHALLLGWLSIVSGAQRLRLAFNTRSHYEIESFMKCLLESVFAPRRFHRDPVALGPEIGIKLRNEIARTVYRDERRLASLSLPESPKSNRWSRQGAASLVILTDRRVLWVTDLCEGHVENYGCTTLSAEPESVTGFRLADPRFLRMAFSDRLTWTIPVPAGLQDSAHNFAEVFNECVRTPVPVNP